MKHAYEEINKRAVTVTSFPKPGAKPEKESKRKPLKKKQAPAKLTPDQRMKVYQKYDGRCSYCGHGIEFHEMQVDHKEARARFSDSRDADFWDNLMPSCQACNIRKNTMSIKRFRSELLRDIEQLNRDSAKFKLLLKYGKIHIDYSEIEFYFEKIKRGKP